MSRTCDSFAELRSGLVDDALTPADRERVVTHLLDCEPCRRDVAELRAVRQLLAGQRASAAAPPHLSDQLRSIAGTAAKTPLSTRAFGSGTPIALPSYRRRAQRRSAAGVLAIGVVVSLAGLVGWVAAPAAELSTATEPAEQARELGALAGAPSFFGVSEAALNLSDARPSATTAGREVHRPDRGAGSTMDPAGAVTLLRQAAAAAGTVSVAGRAQIQVRTGSGTTSAVVDVDDEPGRGIRLSLPERPGTPPASLLIAPPASIPGGPDLVGMLARAYGLSGRQGATVAGRRATLIQASRHGRVVARWWIDDATKVLLWQESDDGSAAFHLSTGFSSVRIGAGENQPFTTSLTVATPRSVWPGPGRLAVAPDTAARLTTSGWACADHLAGLELLRLGLDTPSDPGTVTAVYGDGLRTVVVQQQRARLDAGPTGARWDPTLKAWRHDGPVRWATWESGDTVVTVTTQGPAALLVEAASSLPHHEPVATTTLGRIRDGWSKILADSKG